MPETQGRNQQAYTQKAHALKRHTARHNTPCWICGRPIDTTLNWKDPMSFTADHLHELAKGGPLLGELRPAHRACNSSRSNRKKQTKNTTLKTSQKW